VGFEANEVSLFCLSIILKHNPFISDYPPLIDTDEAIINKGEDSKYPKPASLGYPEMAQDPLDPRSWRRVYRGVAERKGSRTQKEGQQQGAEKPWSGDAARG
jgi:hypothetical protein